MSLIEYRLKRDFSKTNEPPADTANGCQQRFVIQRHHASHLHYDFRLEMEDAASGEVVLKSWAIPKNIPLDKGVKHLAIQTEDHPVRYLTFQGIIPAGNYGAGKVEIWDSGKWGLMTGSFQEGRLKFNLLGRNINGRYTMVKSSGLAKDGKDNQDYWLIWRNDDVMLM